MTVKSVSEVNAFVKRLLDGEPILNRLAVKGEVSNFKRYSSGHCYFTLKDETSALKSVMFRSNAESLKFSPKDGMAVVAEGRLSVFPRDGVYQLYCEKMEPEGIGALALAFEQLKQRLAAEGLFDKSAKKPLPFFPLTVGVVTSISGAVLRDIKRVSNRRSKVVSLHLYPVAVQGEGAAEQIANALNFFNRPENKVDVIIVGRGGGSVEDLWCFNEEIGVRAIAASIVPVVSAVGHETDFTLSDFAADVRAATPSQAAELVVPDTAELMRRVNYSAKRITDFTLRNLSDKKTRLQSLTESYALKKPQNLLTEPIQRVDNALMRLSELSFSKLKDKQHKLLILLQNLEALSPARVLSRGFAAVTRKDKPISSIKQVKPGDCLGITVNDGVIAAKVTHTEGDELRLEF